MVINDTKINQHMKNKSWLSIEKIFKKSCYNYKKVLFVGLGWVRRLCKMRRQV